MDRAPPTAAQREGGAPAAAQLDTRADRAQLRAEPWPRAVELELSGREGENWVTDMRVPYNGG